VARREEWLKKFTGLSGGGITGSVAAWGILGQDWQEKSEQYLLRAVVARSDLTC